MEVLGGGINFIDIGCSDRFPEHYKRLEKFINLYGFDLNGAECDRLYGAPQAFHVARYLPYAITETKGPHTLYITPNMYTCSLLEPDMERFGRFAYADNFRVIRTEQVDGWPLSDIPELAGVDVDAIKVDAQGLDLQCLRGGLKFVDDAFLIESEPAFAENYKGETTFGQLNEFMNERFFRLFFMRLHGIPRAIPVSTPSLLTEIVYCETIWLKDYVARAKKGMAPPSKAKALKSLMLTAALGCVDFGMELIDFYNKQEIITLFEYEALMSGMF